LPFYIFGINTIPITVVKETEKVSEKVITIKRKITRINGKKHENIYKNR